MSEFLQFLDRLKIRHKLGTLHIWNSCVMEEETKILFHAWYD